MSFPKSSKQLAQLDLAVVLARLIVVFFNVQQVSHVAKLFGRALEGLDLLPQLRLLSLLFAEHLVDISHGNCLLSAIYVSMDTSSTNGTGFGLRA
jgi:hypothetical protein